MSPLGLKSGAERLLWLFLALLSAVPFLVAPLPILPDLFTHIGRYHVMTHEADRWLAQYYAFDWHILGNLGVDLLMVWLGPLLGTEKAAYLIAAALPPLTVLGLYRLARARYGHVPAPAYAALLPVWSFTFFHGFVNYWLGLALALHVAAAWLWVRQRPISISLPFALAAALLVWLCHTSAWGVLGLIVAAIEFSDRRNFQSFCAKMLPWAVPLVPMLVWRATKGGGDLVASWNLHEKLRGIENLLRAEWQEFDIASVALLILLALWLHIDRRVVRDPAFRLAALGLLIAAVALPSTVLSSYFADVRLYAPLLMIALLAVSGLPRRMGLAVALAGLLLFGVRVAETSIGWIQRGNEIEEDLAALNVVPMGARIAVLAHSSECGVWPLAGRNHAPSLAIPRRHAFVNTQWDIPGQHLMRPIYNDGRGFNDSRSVELFNPAFGCPGFRVRTFLRYLPRDRFDYVWIWEAEAPAAALDWLTPVYTGPTSRLYAIRKSPNPATGG
ncbi:MAG: hypothetical protein ACKOXK_05575 [Chakrabartia sp.]